MVTKPKWFANERRKHFKSLEKWVEAATGMGWEGLNYITVKNWERTGVLPNSLTPENYKIIAQTLGLTLFEVMIREGYDFETRAGELVIPPVAIEFVRKLAEVPEGQLEVIVPALEAQLEALLKLTRQ